MRRPAVIVLACLNIIAAGVLLAILAPSAHMDQESVSVDELKPGAVDLNGDGKYTVGDDLALEWLMTQAPQVLEEATKTAKRTADNGVDLSPYLLSVPPAGSR